MSDETNLVFMVGTGRCGSTLAHELLCRNENVGFISNIDDRFGALDLKGRYNSAVYRNLPFSFTLKGRVRFAPSEAYKLISRKTGIYAEPFRDLQKGDVTPWQRQLWRDFFHIRNQRQECTVFSHKYTGWSRIGYFAEIFPNARFVNIVRDGRAVCNSFLQMPWWDGYSGPYKWIYGILPDEYKERWHAGGDKFHELAAYCWKILINSYSTHHDLLQSGRLLEVRYEDLLDDHIGVMRDICAFSNITVTEKFENQLSKQKIYSSRKNSYQYDLEPWQVSDIEEIIAPELQRYAYI
ncbi:MAG: sulfotransferase [Pseudomonadota bacterium]